MASERQMYNEAIAEKSVYSDQVKRLEMAVFEADMSKKDAVNKVRAVLGTAIRPPYSPLKARRVVRSPGQGAEPRGVVGEGQHLLGLPQDHAAPRPGEKVPSYMCAPS